MNDYVWIGTVIALAMVLTPVWAVARYPVTIAHEAGHALMTVFFDGEVTGVRIHANATGSTDTMMATRIHMVPVLVTGYLFPPLLGLGGAAVLHFGSPTGALWTMIGALAALLFAIRNVFGFLTVITTGAVLYGAIRYGTDTQQMLTLTTLAWLFLIGGVAQVWEDEHSSDSEQLGAATWLPPMFWRGLHYLGSVAALGYGSWLMFFHWA